MLLWQVSYQQGKPLLAYQTQSSVRQQIWLGCCPFFQFPRDQEVFENGMKIYEVVAVSGHRTPSQ